MALSTPITAIELVELSTQQVSHREAEVFLKGLSPGIPALGLCKRAYRLAEARRFEHPAFTAPEATRLARALVGLFAPPRAALVRMLRTANGLREITNLDILAGVIDRLEAARATLAEAAE